MASDNGGDSWIRRTARKLGRRRAEPTRTTEAYPRLMQMGSLRDSMKTPAYKPVARNLRLFSRTPYARRALNRIKTTIAQLEWEICPLDGVEWTPELRRQAEAATYCFDHPNEDDSFRTLVEAVMEDVLCGAGAIEVQLGGDPLRPLWMWPVDGLSIQIYPAWDGSPDVARYFQAEGYAGLGNPATRGVMLRNDELIYVRPNPNTLDPFGVGPLEVAFMSVARLLGVGDFAGNLASNARPSILLNFKDGDQNFISAFRAYWKNEVEGQGTTPITGATDAEAIRLFPDGDGALYLEWQRALIREIATAFDLSPISLGLDENINRSTAEANDDREWESAIRPHAKNLSAYFTREALHRRAGFHQLRHRFVGLNRDDEEATAKIFKMYYEGNAITPNEWRDKLGMPAGDNHWQDMTFADVQIAVRGAPLKDLSDSTVQSLPGGGGEKTTNPGPADVPRRITKRE